MSPIAQWSAYRTSQSASGGQINLDTYDVDAQTGDIVIAQITQVSLGGYPSLTLMPGWAQLYEISTTLAGNSARVRIAVKTVRTSEANTQVLPVVASGYDAGGTTISVIGFGVRKGTLSGLVHNMDFNWGAYDTPLPSVTPPSGALVVRIAIPGSQNAPGSTTEYPTVQPSGWTMWPKYNSSIPLLTSWHTGAAPSVLVNTANDTNPNSVTGDNYGVTIAIAGTGGGDTTPPTITSTSSPSVVEGNALSHALTANETVTWTKISGADFTLSGSTLSLPAKTYPSGPFVAVVRATDTAGNWSEQTITATITKAPLVQVVGFSSGTTSAAAIAGTQSGDLQIAFAYRDDSNTAPTLPSGWNDLAPFSGANSNASKIAYRVAGSTNSDSGTWTNARTTVMLTLRPKSGYSLSVGNINTNAGTSNTVNWPATTLQSPNSNRLFAFIGHRNVDTTIETPPTGMELILNVLDSVDEVAVHATPDSIPSWGSLNQTITGTASGWRNHLLEIVATSSAPSGRRRSVWISLID